MTRQDAENYFREAAEKHPKALYDRIHAKYPGQFTRYTTGAEQYKGSKSAMVRFLMQKADAASDLYTYVTSF